MLPPVTVPVAADRVVEIRFTERADGDLHVDGPIEPLDRRRRAVVDRPWNWLRQVHGTTVVEATGPGTCQGQRGDALVTSCLDAPIAIQSADCAPVILVSDDRIAVVHAGWRGLLDGVCAHAVESVGGPPDRMQAHLGPVIRPLHYEFGEPELDTVVAAFGPTVRSCTAAGTPALDLPTAVRVALAESGVTAVIDHGYDTADQRFFSFRLRSEVRHQSSVAWMRPT